MTWLIDSGDLRFASDDQLDGGKTYYGDLSREQAIRYSRALRFWPHGSRGGSLATGTIRLENSDGRYDDLLRTDLRDQRIRVRQRTPGGDVIALTAIIDGVTAPDDRSIEFRLRDTLTRFDRPLQTKRYSDSADEGVEGRTLPVTLGVVRNVRPTMWEAFPESSGPAYRVHDWPIAGLANVRDRGITLNPNLDPAEYTLDERIGAAGFTLNTEPAGVVTCDVSTTGSAQVAPETPDALGGTGLFESTFSNTGTGFNATSAPGWTYFGDGPGTLLAEGPDQPPFVTPPQFARLESSDLAGRVILTSLSAVLSAGKSYRYRVRLQKPVTGFTLDENNEPEAVGRLILRASPDLENGPSQIHGLRFFAREALSPDNQAGEFSGTFTVPSSGDHFVQLCQFGGRSSVTVELYEVAPPDTETLPGITISDFVSEVVARGELDLGFLDYDDLAALDPNAADIGYYTDGAVTALSVIRAALNSYTADVYTDRLGRMRFAQLRNPAAETPTRTLDAFSLAGPPRVRVDDAPGLTTQATARRNYYSFRDGEFADNLQALPLDLRERFTKRAQFTRAAVIPPAFPSLYKHADSAEPFETLFDDPFDAAFEIQRVVNLFAEPRLFVTCDVLVDAGDYIELDEVVRLKYPRFGLNEGVNFLVTGVTDDVSGEARERVVKLELWGSTNRVFEFEMPTRPDPETPEPDTGNPLEPREFNLTAENGALLLTENDLEILVDVSAPLSPSSPLLAESDLAVVTEAGVEIWTE